MAAENAQIVLKFLQERIEPFSVNEIMQALKLTKGNAQTALNKLVNNKQVEEKSFGKTNMYYLSQEINDGLTADERADAMRQIDRETEQLSAQVDKMQKECDEKSQIVQDLKSQMTLEEAEEKENALIREIEELKKTLNESVNKSTDNKKKKVTNADEIKKKCIKDYDLYVKEYRQRKRLCLDMIDTLMEGGYPKTKKDLLEEMGIETDEDAEFTLPDIKQFL